MGRTILVADDSAAIQKKASGILAGEGLQVLTVSNGVAAIKKLSSLKPLLVLADVSMPGKDGYEVCEFIKTNPELAYIPVLLLVSDLEPYDEQRGARVRADGMVQKPFDPETLISVVTKFVAQAEAAVAQAQVADTIINLPQPSPEFSMPPPLEEQEVAPKSEGVDWGALPEGSAFAEPALYETPLAPPEPTLVMAAPPEIQYEAAPEEPAAETAPEPGVAPEAYYAEPAPVEYAPAAPVEATEEVAPVPSEPVFIEEAPPDVSEHPPASGPEMTMMFRAPVEIAEPVLTDELAPAPPAEEPPTAVEPEVPPVAAEPEVVSAPGAEPETAAALEEPPASVEDVPAVEVEAAPAAEEAVPEVVETPSPVAEAQPAEEVVPEWVEIPLPAAEPQPAEEAVPESVEIPSPVAEAQPAEVAVAPTVRTAVLDPDWVFWIVRTVVVKMSPPAFSAETIEEVARKITDEITAELDSYNPQG